MFTKLKYQNQKNKVFIIYFCHSERPTQVDSKDLAKKTDEDCFLKHGIVYTYYCVIVTKG